MRTYHPCWPPAHRPVSHSGQSCVNSVLGEDLAAKTCSCTSRVVAKPGTPWGRVGRWPEGPGTLLGQPAVAFPIGSSPSHRVLSSIRSLPGPSGAFQCLQVLLCGDVPLPPAFCLRPLRTVNLVHMYGSMLICYKLKPRNAESRRLSIHLQIAMTDALHAERNTVLHVRLQRRVALRVFARLCCAADSVSPPCSVTNCVAHGGGSRSTGLARRDEGGP